ncbi:rRNA biogenesis protein rrp5, partial [Tulasnella sp. 403]
MPAHTKRANEEPSYGSKSKKIRFDNDGNTVSASTSSRPPKADVDFPRGGGTSLSALDNETLRNETFNGVNDELFKTSAPVRPKTPAITKTKGKQKEKRLEITDSEAQAGDFRPHNLTYRNLARGTKILCRVIAVKPLALIVSLPFHLVGHIPITNVSPIYTQRLDSAN